MSSTNAAWSTVDTPIGPFTTIAAADGAVLASGWTDTPEALTPLISATLRPSGLRQQRDLGHITRVIRQFHTGEFAAIDGIPVRQQSGEFLSHAWDVLRKVPPGQPVTYTEYAALAGRPSAVRAAASACARNAAALFVPCHRVLRVGGALGGFRWGLDVKRWLLTHEAQATTG